MFSRFLPTRQSLQNSRCLRWLGPRLQDPDLWHINRHAVARGVAIGAFFGILIPVAQIPAAAFIALFARANLWIAAIATLISNPFTYAPIYYYAYRLGAWLIGTPGADRHADRHAEQLAANSEAVLHLPEWLTAAIQWLGGIGAPLFLGVFLLASTAALLGYFCTHWSWRVRVLLRRRQRGARQPAVS